MPPWLLQFGKMPASASTPPSAQDSRLCPRNCPLHDICVQLCHAAFKPIAANGASMHSSPTFFHTDLENYQCIRHQRIARSCLLHISQPATSCTHLFLLICKHHRPPHSITRTTVIIPSVTNTTAKTNPNHQFSGIDRTIISL